MKGIKSYKAAVLLLCLLVFSPIHSYADTENSIEPLEQDEIVEPEGSSTSNTLDENSIEPLKQDKIIELEGLGTSNSLEKNTFSAVAQSCSAGPSKCGGCSVSCAEGKSAYCTQGTYRLSQSGNAICTSYASCSCF